MLDAVLGEQEKESFICVRMEWKNLSLGINVCHHSASLVMPIGDPQDRFFYHTLALMMDSYIVTCHCSGLKKNVALLKCHVTN